MIPVVGFIVAVYCIARLLQVPVEAIKPESGGRLVWLWLVSLPSIVVIALLAIDLALSSSSASLPALTP